MKPALTLVPRDEPEPIHLSELQRADRKRIDWNAVHLAADKREPVNIVSRVGRWVTPILRGR